MHDIKVDALDMAGLRALDTCLRSQLIEFGYSPKFLDTIAVAEEWMEPRHKQFLYLMVVEASEVWGFRYRQIEAKANKHLKWGEEEAQLVFSIACYLEAKGNP